MSIEGDVDVKDGGGLLPGWKRSYQGRGSGQMKYRLTTKETILLDRHKGPRSSYASSGALSTLKRLFLALPLPLLLTGTMTLDT